MRFFEKDRFDAMFLPTNRQTLTFGVKLVKRHRLTRKQTSIIRYSRAYSIISVFSEMTRRKSHLRRGAYPCMIRKTQKP